MLEVRSLSKSYDGNPVLSGVSFVIRPGEILGFLGPNGAGKSTTLKMIIGLVEPNEGQIVFHGRSVLGDLPAFQHRIGYVPEESSLYPFLSGRECLQLAGRLHGIAHKLLEQKIEDFLHIFSLWDDRNLPVSSYSKGMRQKILFAAALLHNPELLILDEPFSGLDVETALVVRSLLDSFVAQGRMVLFSSHVLEVVEKMCSRVLVVSHGTIVADNAVAELRISMNQASLEGVFSQLTAQRDLSGRVTRILEAMSA